MGDILARPLLPVLAIALALAATAAAAQDATGAPPVQQACAADYARFCTGDSPSLPIETACLEQYHLNLSSSCRTALDAAAASQQSEQDQQ